MTISYSLDVSSASVCSSLRLLFRWRGSIWKSVASELATWLVVYVVIAFAYHTVMIPNERAAKEFETFARSCKDLMGKIPLTFMLAFFVSMIVERWRTTFNNMGWIENSALLTSAHVIGDSEEVVLMRRAIVRYLVLAQILTFRDVSMSVRRRFPNIDTLIKSGFLTESEAEQLDEINLAYNKYWVPINWAMSICQRAFAKGYIHGPPVLASLINELKLFRTNLGTVCNFDWVPVPIAYPQVVFLAVRVYFVLCFFTRQNLRNPQTPGSEGDLMLLLSKPLMSVFEFIFLVGWMKVAEALLNPLGEDDDDFECNFLIDKNIFTGMSIVGEHNIVPELTRDRFSDPNFEPFYSVDSQKLVPGSVDVPMIPISPRRSIGEIPSSERPRQTRSIRSTHSSTSSLRAPFRGILPIDRPRARTLDVDSSTIYVDHPAVAKVVVTAPTNADVESATQKAGANCKPHHFLPTPLEKVDEEHDDCLTMTPRIDSKTLHPPYIMTEHL